MPLTMPMSSTLTPSIASGICTATLEELSMAVAFCIIGAFTRQTLLYSLAASPSIKLC